MTTFHLYRVRAIEPATRDLFTPDLTRQDFLRQLIESRPTNENRAGYHWHIGNVEALGNNAMTFRAGRTTKLTKEKYYEETGDFVEEDDQESPFTFVFLELELGVLALAPKTRLAPTTRGIARNIEKLLNAARYNQEYGVRIEIGHIQDPTSFLDQLNSAYAVVSYKMEFGEPNPFDVEQDFHRPMEELLKETNGKKGSTQVSGEDLEKEPLEELTRSAASTGEEVSARIRPAAGSRPTTKHLRGDPAMFVAEDADVLRAPRQIVGLLRDAYNKIRQSGSDG